MMDVGDFVILGISLFYEKKYALSDNLDINIPPFWLQG